MNFLFVVAFIAASTALQHIGTLSKSSDLRLVVVSNGIAILPCDSREDVEYTWTKDNVPLDLSERIQMTEEGHLILRDAREEDSGVYVCKSLSENVQTEVNVTLIVFVPDCAPHFINFTQPEETIERITGASVKLECLVGGHPTPTVTWFKDGTLLDISKTIESLTFTDLKVTDSGNYTCFVANGLGSVNATFHLQVTSKEKLFNSTRPDLALFHPLNTTVKYGSSATFQCRVRSQVPPNIQWLKKVEGQDLEKMQNHDIIKVQGENFKVLESSEVIERSDGSFLNKLTIPEVYEADSGKYICLGANSMGYSYRTAYLTVLPRARALPLGWNRNVSVHPGHPSSLLVVIPITLGVIVGVMVALVVLCHRRRLDTKAIREEDIPEDSHLQSQVELEGSGSIITKVCGESSNIMKV